MPGRDEVTSSLLLPYDAKIAVNDGGDVYVASVSYDGGTLCLKFSEPSLLCGISYGFSGKNSYIVYNELYIPFAEGKSGDRISNGVLVWKKMLLPEGGGTVRRVSEGQKRYYVLTDGETEYFFDCETGAPASIRSGDITITFSDFRGKNDTASEGTGADLRVGS